MIVFLSVSLEGLKEFMDMIKDYIMSLIDGLAALVSALGSISSLSSGLGQWMPTTVFTFISLSVILIIILRIIGR